MTTQPRGTGMLGKLRNLAAAAAALLGPAAGVALTQPKPAPAGVQVDTEKRVVAYIYGTTPVTREELGDFLIARGGYEKLDLLVNRIVIELEAARRHVSVTTLEMTAAVEADIRSLGVSAKEFEDAVLPRYGKRMYEWEQDVVRPRLLLSKLCLDRAKPTEDELRRAFENRYGERREALVIAWPKAARPLTADVRQVAREKPDEFEKLAANQPDGRLAKVGGKINPVGRHPDGWEAKSADALFALKPGEISEWIETEQGSLCLKLVAILPPDPKANLQDPKVRGELEKDVTDAKLGVEIPKLFDELRKAARPVYTQHVPPPPPVPEGVPPLSLVPRVQHPDPKVLAVLYGSVLVTREHLGEFLIARGGYEKLDVLVNKKVIDIEAQKRGIAVTPQEVEAALEEDIRTLPAGQGPGGQPLPITRELFVTKILPLKKMSLYEYTEDVIRPRVILGKLCRDRVKVTDEDVSRLYENKYGEKRAAQIIIWPKDQARVAPRQWAEARQSDEAFDRLARQQETPYLAAAAGRVAPVGKYTESENPIVEHTLYTLQPGEVSHLFETKVGIVCVKYVGPVPAAGVKPEDVKAALEKEAFDRKLAKEMPACYAELKRVASPNIFLKGPPTDQENAEGVRQLLHQLPQK
jgi:hypothetical protein